MIRMSVFAVPSKGSTHVESSTERKDHNAHDAYFEGLHEAEALVHMS